MLIGVRALTVMAAFIILAISGCTAQFDESMQNLDNDRTLSRLKEFKTKTGFDFSKISVAKMKVDDQEKKITSLRPEILSGFKDTEGESVTMAMFNASKDALVLFTRDATKKMGFEVQLPLAEFERKKEFLFPVADSNSRKVVNKTISLVEFTSR